MNGVKVTVVGEGLMGRGIAACLAAGGPNDVWICGLKAELVEDAVKKATEMTDFMKRNGVAAAKIGTIHGTTSLAEAAKGAEFIFEAIWEDLEAKKSIFAQLEPLVGSSA